MYKYWANIEGLQQVEISLFPLRRWTGGIHAKQQLDVNPLGAEIGSEIFASIDTLNWICLAETPDLAGALVRARMKVGFP